MGWDGMGWDGMEWDGMEWDLIWVASIVIMITNSEHSSLNPPNPSKLVSPQTQSLLN